jgi:hypothetical protein
VLPGHRKRELRSYLAYLLEKKTAAELKGILNREKRAIAFNSNGARLFFELSLEMLTGDLG